MKLGQLRQAIWLLAKQLHGTVLCCWPGYCCQQCAGAGPTAAGQLLCTPALPKAARCCGWLDSGCLLLRLLYRRQTLRSRKHQSQHRRVAVGADGHGAHMVIRFTRAAAVPMALLKARCASRRCLHSSCICETRTRCARRRLRGSNPDSGCGAARLPPGPIPAADRPFQWTQASSRREKGRPARASGPEGLFRPVARITPHSGRATDTCTLSRRSSESVCLSD